MNRRYRAAAFVLALVTLVADQVSKEWALRALSDGTYHRITGFFGLQLHYNPGAAFSFLTNATWIFTIVAAAVAVALPVWMRRMTSRAWLLTSAVVWGGAVGNLLDRLLRAPGFPNGHVVDFIVYGDMFIGNVADIALVGGIVLLAGYSAFGLEAASRG